MKRTFNRRYAGSGAIGFALALMSGAVASAGWLTAGAEPARPIPAPAMDEPAAPGRPPETAVLAGGCFWGVQGVFQHVDGVASAVSGYAGGDPAKADYESVTTGRTGHAEAVRITFDPGRVSYGRILQIYFSVAHDPTELNRQGPDTGTQYRSALFPADEEQARVAKAYIAQLDEAKAFTAPVVTTIEPGQAFHPAEGYHQDFLTRHPTHPYIVRNDLPKIEDLKRLFPALYRAAPALVADSRPAN